MLTEKMFFRINFAEKEATGRIKLDVSATENLRFAKPDYRCLFEAVFSQSAEEADLFINSWVANAILQLLWQLFRKGGLDYRGFFINLDSGRMNPIPIQ